MIIETVRLDAETKKHLSTLKRRTGVENWNVLCRWAFCISLAQKEPPRDISERPATAIEMTWRTFAGEYGDIYHQLLIDRCRRDYGGMDKSMVHSALRNHISRGISHLIGDKSISSAAALCELAAHEDL